MIMFVVLTKTINMKHLILIICISLFSINIYAPSHKFKTTVKNTFDWDYCLNELKQFIKETEGFSDPYYCPAGQPTIYYGHLLKQSEKSKPLFQYPYTKSKGEIVLDNDIKQCLYYAKFYSPTLKDNQLIAISHFIFNTGIGNYVKSDLKMLIDSGSPIDTQIVKYNFHRWFSKKHQQWIKIQNPNLDEMRNWELEMFNKKFIKIEESWN